MQRGPIVSSYFANTLQQRLSTALVWLGDAIASLSRTAWPLVDLLIRIWIGKLALVLSVLISTDWAMAVSMAADTYPIPVAGLGSTALASQVYWLAAFSLIDSAQMEAAASLGARPWRILRQIILPAALPALLAGGSLCLLLTVNEFGIVLFIGAKGEIGRAHV